MIVSRLFSRKIRIYKYNEVFTLINNDEDSARRIFPHTSSRIKLREFTFAMLLYLI